MYCRICGTQLPEDSNYCYKCGVRTTGRGGIGNVLSAKGTSRSWIILILGILSVILFGPLTGIPAAILGFLDLRKIKRGIISARAKLKTVTGLILGIIGTFFIPSLIFTYVYTTAENAIEELPVVTNLRSREALIQDGKNLGNRAQQFYEHSSVVDSLKSFEAWEIPLSMVSSAAGTYSVSSVTKDKLTIKGYSYDSLQSVFVTVTPDSVYTNDD